MIWTYFVYPENVLIPNINSKKLNQIFFIYDSYSHIFGTCPPQVARAQYSFKTTLLLNYKRGSPSMYSMSYCDCDQLVAIPELVTSSKGPIHSSGNRLQLPALMRGGKTRGNSKILFVKCVLTKPYYWLILEILFVTRKNWLVRVVIIKVK